MKSIKLIVVPPTKDGVIKEPIFAKEIIRNVVSGSTSGMTLAQMRQRGRVLDALDALADDAETLQLEDSDFATLKQATESMQWNVADRSLLQVIETILSPEDIPSGPKGAKDKK